MFQLIKCRSPPILLIKTKEKEKTMEYDYKHEFKLWKEWKENEEKILRELAFDENKINELYNFDWCQFNAERRFKRRQNVTHSNLFINYPIQDKKEILSMNDLLDEIEDEALYLYLYEIDEEIQNIIFLKYMGYSVEEISHILDIKPNTIYYKIRKIKKIFKSLKKSKLSRHI